MKIASLLALASPPSLEKYESIEHSCLERVGLILKGVHDCLVSLEDLRVNSEEDRRYQDQLFETVNVVLLHFQNITGAAWNDTMSCHHESIQLAIEKTKKPTTAFDPKGL